MQEFLLKALNQNFRPAGPVDISLFPDHEFDSDEALKLKSFCDLIYESGYGEIIKK
jgi:hypothetical protein